MEDQKDYRYEKKVVIQATEIQDIENYVRLHPKAFSKYFYERRINNIYFDSMSKKNYDQNVAGLSGRLKVRIRWYGDLFGEIKKPVLEIKIKKGELGRKEKYTLKGFTLDRKFSIKKLHEALENSKLPQAVIEEVKTCEPTLINTYKRRYFLSKDKKFRLTIDKEMYFWKIQNVGNSFLNRVEIEDTHILEVKCSYEDFEEVPKIMQGFPYRISANSKYVRGIDLLE